jgi:uroporphyrinogen decarboxylase
MTLDSRQIVYRTLSFDNPPRAPRQLWVLPWAEDRYPEEVSALRRDFPDDIVGVDGYQQEPSLTTGDKYGGAGYTDEWGCVFEGITDGYIGEVKEPLITDWQDTSRMRFPTEWLTIQPDLINRDCESTDKFVLAGCCPRPFEQMQFLRGTENLYIDLADPPARMLGVLKGMHELYCRQAEAWAETDVDAICFMDDWGSQNTLLINPAHWRELFKPLYRDYVQIAHAAGKKAFMHSDGHILAIIPDLVEIGVDALNSQVFCMGVENLEPYAGKITFWGEVDRQHLLAYASLEEVDEAVRLVRDRLWRNGGCIAQCEFGVGAKPENVRQVLHTWSRM